MESKYISPSQKIARKALKSQTGKKEELIKKGIELFTEKGYEATTIDDITRACKTSKGTFYYYFETKEDLIKVGLNGLIDDAYILDTVNKIEGSVIEKIAAYISTYADFMQNQIGWDFNYLWAQVVLNAREEKNARLQKDLDIIKSLFDEGVKTGELIDTDYTDMGKMIINYIYGASFTADLDKENMHILDTTELFCKTMVSLLAQYKR